MNVAGQYHGAINVAVTWSAAVLDFIERGFNAEVSMDETDVIDLDLELQVRLC